MIVKQEIKLNGLLSEKLIQTIKQKIILQT